MRRWLWRWLGGRDAAPEIEAAAREDNADEQDAARQRLLNQARRLPHDETRPC